MEFGDYHPLKPITVSNIHSTMSIYLPFENCIGLLTIIINESFPDNTRQLTFSDLRKTETSVNSSSFAPHSGDRLREVTSWGA